MPQSVSVSRQSELRTVGQNILASGRFLSGLQWPVELVSRQGAELAKVILLSGQANQVSSRLLGVLLAAPWRLCVSFPGAFRSNAKLQGRKDS